MKFSGSMVIGLAGLLFIVIATSAAFAVPTAVNYQGYLTDDSGVPVSGTISITFRIYDALTDGTLKWNETHDVDVSNGVYSVQLGTGGNPLDESVFTGEGRYLEVEIDGTPLSPRLPFTSNAYAIRAGIANTCETPSCNPGDFIGCYTGDTGTMGVGICASGTRTCGEEGVFGPCVGEVNPDVAGEDCTNGLDDDCDGYADCDDPDCSLDLACACVDADDDGYYAIDELCPGSNDCDDSDGSANPGEAEVCDGVDNDCNGSTDEDLGTSTCGIGECERTVQACIGGIEQTCVPGPPMSEICDGLDNDCNGVVDNSADASCNDGVACTTDACFSGSCSYTPDDSACDDGSECTIDTCDPGHPASDANGCLLTNITNDTPCSGGTCQDGICQ